MFGNVGLADRLTFSAFGSAVNTASRLQDLTKIYATPVVASQDFRDYAGGLWELLGEETLRGLDHPVPAWAPVLEGGAGGCRPEPAAGGFFHGRRERRNAGAQEARNGKLALKGGPYTSEILSCACQGVQAGFTSP